MSKSTTYATLTFAEAVFTMAGAGPLSLASKVRQDQTKCLPVVAGIS